MRPAPSSLRARRPEPTASTAAREQVLPLLVMAGVLLVVGFVWVMLVGTYAQYAAALIAGGLVLLTIPIARHAARVENWPALSGLLMLAFVARMGGSLARYFVAYGAYGGVADASTYTDVAKAHYKAFRQFHLFTPDTSVFHGLVPWLDTVVYALFGPTELGAFLVFAWFNFLGTYFFFRAFRIGYPEGDGRRYGVLLFFLPSLLYWPSSLGKEAWMVLAIGLAAYGVARALAGLKGGYISLLLGLGGMLLVRPHLALIFLPAAFLAFLFRRPKPGRQSAGIGRVIGIVVLVVSSLVVVAKAQSYFGIKSLDVQAVTQQLHTTRAQTDLGNSAFHPPNAQSPIGFPEAIITVLFRPFPFEAHSVTVLVSSLEGLTLLGLAVLGRKRLARIPRLLRRNPYLLFAGGYSLLFVFAFSNFSNFGILARERVQMLPLLLVLLAVPAPEAAAAPAAARKTSARRPRRPEPRPERRALPSYSGRRRVSGPMAERSSEEAYLNSGRFAALGTPFEVLVHERVHGVLAEPLGWAFEGLRSPRSSEGGEPPRLTYRLSEAAPGASMIRIERNNETVRDRILPSQALNAMMTDINAAAISAVGDRLAIHGGAVSYGDIGILLAGESGSGKSTLTAAMVAEGCDYLTDEAVVIDWADLKMNPYAKPLSLSAQSRLALGCAPVEPLAGDLVPASHLRADSWGGPVRARLLLFPQFVEGSRPKLTRLTRAQAVVELAQNSFNFVDHGGEWLPFLRDVVAGCTSWSLVTGDARRAARMIVEAVGRRASRT